MRVYEAIVQGLESVGVETAFGGNGENIASLTLALEKSSIRSIITRHEQAAAFMACGYAMYTNRLGVCFATVGPGALNLVTGLAVALSDSYPVLAISGYVSLDWQGRGAANDTSGLARTPDSQAIFAATTKRSYLLTDPADTWDVLEEAVNVAFEGRPGPVHIGVPQSLTHRGMVHEQRDVQVRVEPVAPDPAQVEEIVAVLADAFAQDEPVVLLVGFGAVRSHAHREVREFAERFDIPVVTTLDGKGILPEDHPLCAGVFSESGHSSATKVFRRARVVVAIGNSLNQHATFGFESDLFEDKVLVHVNISAQEIGKMYPADHGLVADAALAVRAIHERLASVAGPGRAVAVRRRDPETARLVQLPCEDVIHPGKLAQTIGRLLPERGVLLADAGAHLGWLGYYVSLSEGQSFRKCGTFGPMACHTNAAIGTKMAEPDRTVVVGCGDGCYSMAGFELMTAVEHDVPVIWVIFNDGEFKLVRLYQLATYGHSGLCDIRNPDFAAYARACGADGYSVNSIEDFEDAFRTALGSGRPTVIDAKITRWAAPHYSSSPDGMVAGLFELIGDRIRGE